ncbi:MAG TPA: hypothetical protein VFR74_07420 [Jiangellales bacterium]|nr:hypothetical protein [Jiangellales bacterium]
MDDAAASALIPCPDDSCGLPAEIVALWTWPAPSRPVPYVRTRCVLGHVCTPPVSYVEHLRQAERAR